jgi:hypothetical protein
MYQPAVALGWVSALMAVYWVMSICYPALVFELGRASLELGPFSISFL